MSFRTQVRFPAEMLTNISNSFLSSVTCTSNWSNEIHTVYFIWCSSKSICDWNNWLRDFNPCKFLRAFCKEMILTMGNEVSAVMKFLWSCRVQPKSWDFENCLSIYLVHKISYCRTRGWGPGSLEPMSISNRIWLNKLGKIFILRSIFHHSISFC